MALCIRRTLCRHVTIGTPMVIFCCLNVFNCFWRLVHCWYQQCTYSVPTVKNSQKTVKTAKMTFGVPIVTCLHRVHRIHKVRVRRPCPRPQNTHSLKISVAWDNYFIALDVFFSSCWTDSVNWLTIAIFLLLTPNVAYHSAAQIALLEKGFIRQIMRIFI